MSGGKRKRETLEDLLERPWCYYCEKDFDDMNILQTHQREKHFACENGCTRKLNTASGLQVHTQQVHKKTITQIRNALPGRESPDVEIFGMYGIPDELLTAHKQSIIDGYYQRAAEHRARTGNPLPGTVTQDPNTKGPRKETPEEIKARVAARLAETKARKAAERAAKQAQNSQATQSDNRADSNVSVASPFAADPMQVDARVATGKEGALRSPPTFHQASPVHQDNAAFQLQSPAMTGNPPSYSSSDAFGNPSGQPVYDFNGNSRYAPHPLASFVNTSSSYSVHGGQVPAPVYQQATAPTSSSPPAVPGLPQRPPFNAPALSKNEMANMHAIQHAVANMHTIPRRLPIIDQAQTAPAEVMGLTAKTLGDDIKVSDIVGTSLYFKPGLHFVWFSHGDNPTVTVDEVKSQARQYGYYLSQSAAPTRTTIAE